MTDLAATNNNTFTHCASTTRNDSTTASSGHFSDSAMTSTNGPTSAPTGSSNAGSNIGAIVGGAVGGVLGAIALGLVGFFLWHKHRQSRGPRPLDLVKEYDYGNAQMSAATPFSATNAQGKYLALTPRAMSESI